MADETDQPAIPGAISPPALSPQHFGTLPKVPNVGTQDERVALGHVPDVNELFPEKPLPDVNELFPESVERERYRREQLHTSPVQDFLFSKDGPVGTVFYSAGRVLEAFGHGFTEAGPVTDEESRPTTGLTKEEEDRVKNWVGFDTWSEQSKNIARAASRVLLRPAAYDFALSKHAVSGVMGGVQASVKQYFIERGLPDPAGR
jgi:hypothetical protein